jgi:replicative DNA helicase
MFSRTVTSNWFKTYNPADDRWYDDQWYGAIFDRAAEHFRQFMSGPTPNQVAEWIESDPYLPERQKGEALTTVSRLTHGTRQPSQFNADFDALEAAYLREKLAKIIKSSAEDMRSDPKSSLNRLMKDLVQTSEEIDGAHNRHVEKPQWAHEFIEYHMDRWVDPTIDFVQPFPWESWNKVFGGLRPTEVVIFAALFAGGKSFLVKDLAWDAAERAKEHEFSVMADLEMDSEQIFFRLAAKISGIPIEKVRCRELSAMEEGVFHEAMNAVYEMSKNRRSLLIVPPSHCRSVKQLRAAIAQYGEGRTPNRLCIDYLTMMEPSDPKAGGWEKIGQVVVDLKRDIALAYHIPVISPLHLNKDFQTQYQVVDQRADTVYHMKPSPLAPWKPPISGQYVGTPGIIEVFSHRSRGGPDKRRAFLEVEFSTASLQDSDGDILGKS